VRAEPDHVAMSDEELETAARALLALASRAMERRALDEASGIAHAVAVLAEGASSWAEAALAHQTEARIHHLGEDMDAARACFAKAVRVQRAQGDERGALRTEIAMAFVLYDEGDGEGAARLLDDVEARAAAHLESLSPQLAGYRGNLARQRGDHAHAHALYAQAVSSATERGDALFALVFAMDDGITLLLEDDLLAAHASLSRTMDAVLALPPSDGRVVLGSTVRHYLTLVRLALGVPVEDVHEGPPSESLRAMRETLARARSEVALGELEDVGLRTEHARLTRQILERITRARSDRARVIVQRDGRYVVRGDGRVDLSQRQALRNLLRALIETLPSARGGADAEPKTASALIAAGWPGESIMPRAAKNRLHVALTTLRQLGLGAALRSEDHAYALDPEIVRIVG
jgi:tetratricopeptide (TPR) repeat protein